MVTDHVGITQAAQETPQAAQETPQGRQAQDLPGSCLAAGTQAGSQHVAMDGCVTWHDPGGTLRRTGCQSGMGPRMGVKPRVGMHQIGMRNAPQAGTAGTCLGHGNGGNDNVMTVASQAGFSLQTPESACACRLVSTGNVCSSLFSTCGVLTHWLHGATAARLTPDQKVGSWNLSVVIFPSGG